MRLATPLLFACLAGLVCERAGIFDIGLEGKMLASAFFSAAVAAISGSVWIGLLAGVMASVALAGVHGLASITFRGNQLISGVAINFLASGLTVLIAQDWFGQGGRTPSLSGGARFNEIKLPFADLLSGLPYIGQSYAELFSGHSLLVYVGFLTVPLTWWVIFRTRFGLRLRAAGENPEAVDTAGVNVIRLRYTAIAICGLLCGLAGVYLATGLQAGFVKEMSSGRGFIALAALIFREMAAMVRPVLVPSLRLFPGAFVPAGRREGGDEPGRSRPASGRASLHPDRGHPCRFCRKGRPPARWRRTIRQGELTVA